MAVFKQINRILASENFWRMLDKGLHAFAKRTINRLPGQHHPEVPRCLRNYAYADDNSPAHRLDIWLPAPKPGPTPVVFYIHGGGFAIGSKDSHRIIGHKFAARGYLTFMINYRLAPRYQYPASIEDCCKALCWVWDNLEHFGGNRQRLIIAGESAGGNLAAVTGLITCYKRPEPFCQMIWQKNIRPWAVIPFCGWHEPSQQEHYKSHPLTRRFSGPALAAIARGLFGRRSQRDAANKPLLSAIQLLAQAPDRALPPFLIPVGTADPIYADSILLKKALDKHGAQAVLLAHPGAWHAHHLLPFTPGSRRVWRDVEQFLNHLEQQTRAA